MHIYRRSIGPTLLAAAFLISVAGAARAGGEGGGDITFRLILRGTVIEGDSFTLAVNDLGPTGLIISPGTRCGPVGGVDTDPFVPCQPGTYEVVLSTQDLPIGNQLEYVWARNYGQGENRRGDIIYRDTVTVTENAQVFTVVYDYGGGAVLPDTAVGAAVEPVPLGLAAIIGSVLMGVATATRSRGRQRSTPRRTGAYA